MKIFKVKCKIICAALAAIMLLTACSDSGTSGTVSSIGEQSGSESSATTEQSGSETSATTEQSGSETSATTEQSGSESSATTEQSGSESSATTEQSGSESSSTSLSETVTGSATPSAPETVTGSDTASETPPTDAPDTTPSLSETTPIETTTTTTEISYNPQTSETPKPDNPQTTTPSTEAPETTTTTTKAPETTTTTTTKAPETTTTTTTTKTPEENPDIANAITLEAEDGTLGGGLYIVSDGKYSGGKAVGIFSSDSDRLGLRFEIEADGLYDITIKSEGIGGEKDNNVKIDNKDAGTFHSKTYLSDYTMCGISLTKGNHTMMISKSWGYINLDCVTISPAEKLSDDIYNVPAELVNKNSTQRTRNLYSLIRKNYGKNVISGQFCDGGIYGNEFKAIYNETGKYPAMLGLDMMDYTPSRVELGARSSAVEKALEFDKKGGIVTFCWHWNAPTEYLYSTENSSNGWWGGFYTDKSSFDIAKVMNGQDEKGKQLLDRDIKAIAEQLLRLQRENVPVLWRPLHEGSGGWFWWGAKGADAYKKLWVYLYEQLTDVYGCNNLIWVYNGQSMDFYPGDKYVDIIGEDIYPGEKVYSPQADVFKRASEYPTVNKIVALTENGCLFDIDDAFAINACWSFFTTWGGGFVTNGWGYSEQYTEKYMLKKVYTHQKVITLDEMEKF